MRLSTACHGRTRRAVGHVVDQAFDVQTSDEAHMPFCGCACMDLSPSCYTILSRLSLHADSQLLGARKLLRANPLQIVLLLELSLHVLVAL